MNAEYPRYFGEMSNHLLAIISELYDRGLVTSEDFNFVRFKNRTDSLTEAIHKCLDYGNVVRRTAAPAARPGILIKTETVDLLSIFGAPTTAPGQVVFREEVDG